MIKSHQDKKRICESEVLWNLPICTDPGSEIHSCTGSRDKHNSSFPNISLLQSPDSLAFGGAAVDFSVEMELKDIGRVTAEENSGFSK